MVNTYNKIPSSYLNRTVKIWMPNIPLPEERDVAQVRAFANGAMGYRIDPS